MKMHRIPWLAVGGLIGPPSDAEVRHPRPRQRSRFQRIENGETEFGPGDPGYLGGRWWADSNQNGIQDPEDHYFLCPLLPPGRPTS